MKKNISLGILAIGAFFCLFAFVPKVFAVQCSIGQVCSDSCVSTRYIKGGTSISDGCYTGGIYNATCNTSPSCTNNACKWIISGSFINITKVVAPTRIGACCSAGDCPSQTCKVTGCSNYGCTYSNISSGTSCTTAGGSSGKCDGNGTCKALTCTPILNGINYGGSLKYNSCSGNVLTTYWCGNSVPSTTWYSGKVTCSAETDPDTSDCKIPSLMAGVCGRGGDGFTKCLTSTATNEPAGKGCAIPVTGGLYGGRCDSNGVCQKWGYVGDRCSAIANNCYGAEARHAFCAASSICQCINDWQNNNAWTTCEDKKDCNCHDYTIGDTRHACWACYDYRTNPATIYPCCKDNHIGTPCTPTNNCAPNYCGNESCWNGCTNVKGTKSCLLTLDVTKNGSGSGTVSSIVPDGRLNCGVACSSTSATFNAGTSVTLRETSEAGSTFSGWSGEDCSGTASTCTVSMNVAKNVTASFTLSPPPPPPPLPIKSYTCRNNCTLLACGQKVWEQCVDEVGADAPGKCTASACIERTCPACDDSSWEEVAP
jgi:hypothetical protein